MVGFVDKLLLVFGMCVVFDGIEFCRDPVGVAQIVCMSIEDRKLQTIVKTDDGRAMKFSLFSHVKTSIDTLDSLFTNL